MTHDELLAKIDANGTKYDGNTGITTEVVTRPHRNDKALRAVVALHKPVMAWTGAYDYNDAELWAEQCDYCSSNGFSQTYPCRNIQSIEKELG